LYFRVHLAVSSVVPLDWPSSQLVEEVSSSLYKARVFNCKIIMLLTFDWVTSMLMPNHKGGATMLGGGDISPPLFETRGVRGDKNLTTVNLRLMCVSWSSFTPSVSQVGRCNVINYSD
jgi:hypothetical protein